MDTDRSHPSAPRQANGRWQKGQSGNPAGRPAGSRNRATLLAEALLEGEAEAIVRTAIERAKAGDVKADVLRVEQAEHRVPALAGHTRRRQVTIGPATASVI